MTPGLSARARRLVGSPSKLVLAHVEASSDPYDAQRNPGGYVNLGTAENHLVFDLLEPRLAAARQVDAMDTHYGPLHGTAEMRDTTARLLTSVAGVTVDPEHLALLSGASAGLDALAYALCDEGEAVVVPSPYYGGFDVDFTARARVQLIPAPLDPASGFALDPTVIRRAVEDARTGGTVVRAVALISPHNPTGRVHSAAAIAECVHLTRELGVHLIVDEIYAMSLFGGHSDVQFASALRHDRPEEDHVHVMWGYAKDFALSGFKVGVVHSRHPDVLSAVIAQAYLSPVSTDVQRTLVGMLADQAWVADFVAENQRRLAASHAHAVTELERIGITTVGAQAGVFAWLDLSRFLTEPTRDAEAALWRRLFDEGRVNLAPGLAFHCAEPGWFRMTHSVPPGLVTEAVDRMRVTLRV